MAKIQPDVHLALTAKQTFLDFLSECFVPDLILNVWQINTLLLYGVRVGGEFGMNSMSNNFQNIQEIKYIYRSVSLQAIGVEWND